MNWKPELDELRRREAFAHQMGGREKIKRQHDGGRLTVRERIDRLLDKETFHELGAITGLAKYSESGELTDLTPSNVIIGRGKINGSSVVLIADDFTVRGGSADASLREKHTLAEQMANQLRLPLIRLVEGSGGGGSVKTIEMRGRANVPSVHGWEWVVKNIATVPRVALGLGSVAGLGAAHLAASHYSVMVKDTSALFVAGPPLVEHVGQHLDKQELGGYLIHTRNGSVDDAVDTEEDAFTQTRRFLSYLPSSIYSLSERVPPDDDPERRDESLLSVIPRDRRKVYKMRPIVETIVDRNSFFELAPHFGRSIITGFARIDGWPILLLASDPYHYGGAWTADACQKVTRFIDLAQTFHLPIVYFVDCPGFLIGAEAEQSATIRYGVRAMSALFQATTPWCSIVIRNLFGVAGSAHRNSQRFTHRYAWPSARWGSLPLEGGIEAAYRSEIESATDSKSKLKEIETRLENLRSPFRSAETFLIEEIIDPRDTRRLLAEFVHDAAPLRETGPSSFGMRP